MMRSTACPPSCAAWNRSNRIGLPPRCVCPIFLVKNADFVVRCLRCFWKYLSPSESLRISLRCSAAPLKRIFPEGS